MVLSVSRWRLAAAAAASFAVPTTVLAADTAFSIPQQPRQAALLAFARQAGLSLGFTPEADCRGLAGLNGRMSVDEGLTRLLAGSGCDAHRPDARTIVIRPAKHAARAVPTTRTPAEAGAGAGADLAEVVVTADKTERLLSQSASALTAMTGKDLARAGVADVGDLSLMAAGLTVTNLGPGRDKVILRGLSDGPLTGHTQSTVGLYLGDLRLTYNAPDPDLPLADIARVEVLRGPQGSLYGAGSIGGVLHIVPRKPDPTAFGGLVSASIGDRRHGSPSYGLQAVLNQPIPAHDAAVRFVGWSEQTGGAIDDVTRGLKDIDRTRRLGFRVSALWRVSPAFEAEAMVVDQNIGTRDAHYADPAIGALARGSAIAQPHDNDFLAASIGGRWSLDWGSITATLGALDHDVGTTYDASTAPASLAAAGSAPRSFKDDNEIRALVAEARAASSGASKWRWTLGAFASLGDQWLDGEVRSANGAVGYREARRDKLHEAALFGEASYDVAPWLTATAGARLFEARLRANSNVASPGGARAFRDTVSYTGLAPKFVLAVRPWQDVTVYASAAEGYRTAGFNTAGALGQTFSQAGGPQPLRRYVGDELWSYELGARWRADVIGLAARVAAFQADWADIQADLLLPSGLPFTSNLGDGRSRGVEGEASWRRGPLEVNGAFVLQDPELIHPAEGLRLGDETSLPGVPNVSFSASAAYETPLARDWSASLRATYAYVGPSRLLLAPGNAARMGGYDSVRLAITLSSPEIEARLAVDNALDGRGDTLAFGNPFLSTRRAATPQAPASVTATLTRRF